MRILSPASPLNPRVADDFYEPERQAHGLPSSLFDFDAVLSGAALRFKPGLEAGEVVVYRGWMLRAEGYARLEAAVAHSGARLLTSSAQYRLTHHLPEWIALLEKYTPRTRCYADARAAMRALEGEPGPFFVKDWVKSLSTGRGSIAHTVQDIAPIAADLERTRGSLEGGLCVRDVEHYLPDSEERCFVAHGQAFARDGHVPEIVRTAAAHVPSPFFAVDIATRADGVLRIVELGDGGVSDLKQWTPEAFKAVLESLARDR
jgi:hypothetical protein